MPKGTLFFIVLQQIQIQLKTAIENRWPQLPKDYYMLQFYLSTNYTDYTNFCRVFVASIASSFSWRDEMMRKNWL
jgi:hypothetical protein